MIGASEGRDRTLGPRRETQPALRTLSATLLADLKEARERLQQNSTNSSRPPSSRAPWKRGQPATVSPECEATPADAAAVAPEAGADTPPARGAAVADTPAAPAGASADRKDTTAKPESGPKPPSGKQPGTPGVGRTEVFEAHTTERHRPTVCAVCARVLATDAPAISYTGFQWDKGPDSRPVFPAPAGMNRAP